MKIIAFFIAAASFLLLMSCASDNTSASSPDFDTLNKQSQASGSQKAALFAVTGGGG